MFSYTFSDEEKERASKHAEFQIEERGVPDNKDRKQLIEAKTIGALGEIAFNEFCRLFIPSELWEWYHREALKEEAGETTEYDPHDFVVFQREVDIKTSTDPARIDAESQWELDYWRKKFQEHQRQEGQLSNGIQGIELPDFYIFCLSRFKHDQVIIVGWARARDIAYLAHALPENQRVNLGEWYANTDEVSGAEWTFTPIQRLYDFLQLGPPQMMMR